MITALASLISLSVITFSVPADPCVSIFISYPISSAANSRASAAMYVCAIPVGHDVIATIFILSPPIIFIIEHDIFLSTPFS